MSSSSKKPSMANRDTPMLRQYMELKEQVPGCVLFFRMGDFYEVFFEDAILTSKILGIQLTSRDKANPDPIPMAGVPVRAVNAYLARMIEAGLKVAIGEQVGDPQKAKGLVTRKITRVMSPGMFIDPQHLPAGDNRYLAALALGAQESGLAILDLASGEFRATSVPAGPALNDELARLEPAELVCAQSQENHPVLASLAAVAEVPMSSYGGRPPTPRQAEAILDGRLPGESEDYPALALTAAAMAWETVVAAQMVEPLHIEPLDIYQVESHMVLDATARRNLELYRSIAGRGKKGSLLHAVDRTKSPMGARLLREWLGFPLMDLLKIEERHQAVDELCAAPLTLESLAERLWALPDLPRLVGRASLGQANPRDMAGLRDCLIALPGLAGEISGLSAPLLSAQARDLMGLDDLARLLQATLTENPPGALSDGGVIAAGIDPDLDEQRRLGCQGKDWIAGLQVRLRGETNIPSLKVGFNKVFGYYIEVTKTHLDKVPSGFIRKQTLAGGERFITPELKEQEAKVLTAEEKALELERAAFEKLRGQVAAQSRPLMTCARALAAIDVLAGLARLALSHEYVRPRMSLAGPLSVQTGRHPVVEQMLKEGEFVPNDLHLDMEDQQVMIITGPNMAGKSTILRQAALICILAQAGSFVPAGSADLPVVDRIFTRVGAMDDLAGGRSTFMVEMTETSQILAQASPRSLVILDEVGRGTSTFDGLSIAWAVAEHLHALLGVGVKTLFATHYHELTELAAAHARVRNFNVAVKEYQGGIVFLRKLTPGAVSRSYGIQVARLAGLPDEVLERAREILAVLESDGCNAPALDKNMNSLQEGQLDLFAQSERLALERLRDIDLHTLTPLQALNLLDELKRDLY